MTPVKAIRNYCVYQCYAGSTRDVRECNATDCPLYPYRMGKNPSRSGIGGNPKIEELNNGK